MIGEYLVSATFTAVDPTTTTRAPYAGFESRYGSSAAGTVAAKTSFSREAAPWLRVSGPEPTGASLAPLPAPLDRAVAPSGTTTAPATLSPAMIAAAVVTLGVAGLVVYKLRKRR